MPHSHRGKRTPPGSLGLHVRLPSSAGFSLIEIMIVVLIIGVLLTIAVPNWIRARNTSQANACIDNLTKIQCAKEQYILTNNLGSFTDETDMIGGPEPLVPTYLSTDPQCPAGGIYHVGTYGVDPTCSLAAEGHVLQ